jgi:hypothetical protein
MSQALATYSNAQQDSLVDPISQHKKRISCSLNTTVHQLYTKHATSTQHSMTGTMELAKAGWLPPVLAGGDLENAGKAGLPDIGAR